MLETLRGLVELESPSHDKAALERLAQRLAREFAHRGGKAQFHDRDKNGPHVQLDFTGGSGKPVLLLGHYDTVWAVGTLGKMPFHVDKVRAWGPGIFDMKAGIVMMMCALEALAHGGGLPRPVTVLLVSDEEIGSESSRAVTESLARTSAAVLVLEPAYGPKGACKTARKGVGDFAVRVTGVAAHSGLDFEKGHNAVLELARQIERVAGFTDLKRGITVSANIVRGGARRNVVPAEAEAEIDVRIAHAKDGATIGKKFRSLKPFDPKCRIEVRGGINRPPLERTREVARLYGQAREIARELGFELKEAAVGGGSDGNFTAGLGIPTLDGLGAVGDGAHATTEHVLIAELPRRAAMLARLIETV
ncbi:MAG: M20 family metallopeptidase [Acidobacteriia bacterium]|nr:M20 family metallopeptidase [Terriglobia bacterium]